MVLSIVSVVALVMLVGIAALAAMRLGGRFAEQHRALLRDLHAGLTAQGDRVHGALAQTREAVLDAVHRTLAEQGRASTHQIVAVLEQLERTTDSRLEQISGKVSERLDEGFRKTNETFAQVMARLATIDEAQRKIDGLTTNVVS